MLRARLLTSLAFNLAIAVWVLVDARSRGARKPAFAALLALMWGPLGLGFWESDRPLGLGERRTGGTAAVISRGFLRGWAAMLPAVAVLVYASVEHNAAVPGSLGRTLGLPRATILMLSMLWAGPAALAVALGRLARTRQSEGGTSAVTPGPVASTAAAAAAGALALACALLFA